MGSSRSFGSTTSDNFALFRLGFPVAPIRKILTGPLTVTRRIIMQKARRHTLHKAIVLRPLVSAWFQVHVPPLDGVLLIFRSLYWFAIGRQRVFSLAGWSPRIQSGFHVTGFTQVPLGRPLPVTYGAVTRCGRPFHAVRLVSDLVTPI